MLVGFFMLEALGINTRNILTGAGIGGAIFVLAYKDLFTNLLGSLSILLSKTFEIGDTIRVRTIRLWIEGMVEEITLNHTKITNKTGEVVYVPNKVIYSESVENLSRRRFYSYELLVPFAKTTPSEEISHALRVIEGKINSFFPIDVEYTMSNTNATDYTYTITVLLPEENNFFDFWCNIFLGVVVQQPSTLKIRPKKFHQLWKKFLKMISKTLLSVFIFCFLQKFDIIKMLLNFVL